VFRPKIKQNKNESELTTHNTFSNKTKGCMNKVCLKLRASDLNSHKAELIAA